MLSQQNQEMQRNVPDPLFAGGSHFCGSGAGDETKVYMNFRRTRPEGARV